MISCKSERELTYMRDAGRINARTHAELAKAVKVGVTTRELDRLAEDFIIKAGGRPAFKDSHGYPTASHLINEEVVHGLPV